jgi:uncharacterized NAD(P)/FAD-binding protein YdhS
VKISLYFDEDSMARSLVAALQARGTDVQTVVDAGLRGKGDEIQLEWAASKKRVVYTSNASDFGSLHKAYLEKGGEHAGIIVVPRQRYTLRQQIRLLLDVVKMHSAEDMRNRLLFL